MATPLRKPRRSHGMTLVEVMVSMAIFTVLGGMICALTINVSWSLFATNQKASIDKNFRTTTSVLTKIAGSADFVYVFDMMGSYGPSGAEASKSVGETGELFVAVYYKNPGKVDPFTGKLDTTISRIVGVFRDVNRPTDKALGDDESPIYLFDSDVDRWDAGWKIKFSDGVASTDQVSSITNLLPTLAQARGYARLSDRAFATSATINAVTGKPALFVVNGNATGALMLARIRSGMDGKYVSNAYAYPLQTRNL